MGFVQILAAVLALWANLWWMYYPNDCAELGVCTNVVMTPIILMGLSYGLYAGTAWNSIIYLVPKNVIGTAVGIMSAILNIMLFTVPLMMGDLKDLFPE